MSFIKINKKYNKLVTFGCSFSDGWIYGKENSWGFFLSELLGCGYVNYSNSGSSNYAIMSNVVRYCENNDMSNCCVGIQWSERNRREIWSKDNNEYITFNLSTLTSKNTVPKEIEVLKNNVEFYSDIWFDERENVLRTIQSMILIKNYLENKKIDYVMFEGIGSISDEYSPLNKDEKIIDILNNFEFFTKYGDMRSHMLKIDEWDKNDGHPNPQYAKWWSNEIYNYLKEINL